MRWVSEMSVQKFRSADEAARELLREGHHGDRLERIAFMLRLAASLVQRRYPTGVRRYRTPAEADADRIAWQREHVTRRRRISAGKRP